jgi:hypothetical protein
MSRPYPENEVVQVDGGLASNDRSGRGVVVVVATANAGTANTPTVIRRDNSDQPRTVFGPSPLAEACALAFEGGAATVVAVKAATTTGGARGSVTKHHGDASTQTITTSGTPNSDYSFKVEVLADADETGNVPFRVSRDGGQTFGPQYLTTGSGPFTHTDNESGVSIVFPKEAREGHTADESYAEGDSFTFTTTRPLADNASLLAAMNAALATNITVRRVHIAQPTATASLAALIAALNTRAVTLESSKRWVRISIEAALNGATTGEAVTALLAVVSPTVASPINAPKVSVSAYYVPYADPFTGDIRNAHCGALVAGTSVARELHDPTGRPGAGPLGQRINGTIAVTSFNSGTSGAIDEGTHTKPLNQARVTVLRIWPDFEGVFVADEITLATPGSDFELMEHCRVQDAASSYLYQLTLMNSAQVPLPLAPPQVVEAVLKTTEEFYTGELGKRLGRSVSTVVVTIPRGQNVTTNSELEIETDIVPTFAPRRVVTRQKFRNPFAG